MNRRSKWGVITALTVGLVTPLFWHDLPPYPARAPEDAPGASIAGTGTYMDLNQKDNTAGKQQKADTKNKKEDTKNKKADTKKQRTAPAVMKTPKGKGNERIVAKDIARSAALCVRDCRTMLTEMSNELAHAKTEQERLQVLQHHMKEHTQFVSLTLRDSNNQPITVGRVLRPDLHTNAHQYAIQDNFYVSDLYMRPMAGDPKEKVGMTLGVPVLSENQVSGTLTADVEMGHLMQVIHQQNDEMDTATALIGVDGQNEVLRDGDDAPEAKGGVRTKQVNPRTAEAKVEGTGWKVRVTSLVNRGNENAHLPREVLAVYDRDLSPEEIAKITQDIDGTLVRHNNRHAYIFRGNTDDLGGMIRYFKSSGALIAEPHVRLKQNDIQTSIHAVTEQPNDVFYGSHQWNLPLIAADKAWQATTGDPETITAVVDTGVDLNHPEFSGRLVEGRNMIADNNRPQDDNGHGTHVAGIIGARTNNLEGIAGVDWNSKIMPIKAMAGDGTGTVVDIADGIVWAVDHGADVINLSLGEYNDSDYLHAAIKYAYDKGVVLIAAMGNDGVPDPSYPAAYPEVIGVAANDETTETASFSNYGGHTSISAPGVAIPSTYPDRRYVALSGTSMAAPHVAGVAALIRSVNPKLTPDQVRKILEETADDLGDEGKDEIYGYGQVNVARALKKAAESNR